MDDIKTGIVRKIDTEMFSDELASAMSVPMLQFKDSKLGGIATGHNTLGVVPSTDGVA